MKRKFLLTVLCLAASLAANGCSSAQRSNSRSASPEVKKGVSPVADPEAVLIEMEEPAYGSIKIELYSNLAPQMVARFKELARKGYYDGIIFHRVNGSVIQAGDSNTKPGAQPNPVKEGDSGLPDVVAEFSDVPYDTAIVGAARLGSDVNSQNSQFFITLKREPAFDGKYTVFGKVIEGMNNVRTIAGAPRDGEKPKEPIRIKKASVVPR
jgi:peptidylprolyl isomerase